MHFDLDDAVSMTLTKAEALVFFEVLQRWEASDSTPGDAAEQRALWNLSTKLEKTLAEPFRNDYIEIVEAAKAHLLR